MEKIQRIQSIVDDIYRKDIPLMKVFVGKIQFSKNISRVIQELNLNFPVPELSHLKRVNAEKIIIFPCRNLSEKKVLHILIQKNFNIALLDEKIEIIDVAAKQPLVREQFIVCNKIWPCNFHPNPYLEKLLTNTLFKGKELSKIITFMEMAADVGQCISEDGGVIIVDPISNHIVAVGYNQTNVGLCRHPIMVAIDNVAKTQKGGIWHTSGVVNPSDETNNIISVLKKKYRNFFEADDCSSEKSMNVGNPYLCTGYYVFTIKEPCIMCAMALIHSRCKRLFFRLPIQYGALETLCKIQTVKNLNHHYEVFNVK